MCIFIQLPKLIFVNHSCSSIKSLQVSMILVHVGCICPLFMTKWLQLHQVGWVLWTGPGHACFWRVASAKRLRSLSCWNVDLHPGFNYLETPASFSGSSYSIFPSTLTSFQIKHPHSMRLPPPCFTTGMVFSALRRVQCASYMMMMSLMVHKLIWFHMFVKENPNSLYFVLSG